MIDLHNLIKLSIFFLLLCSCISCGNYDQGYEDIWEERSKKGLSYIFNDAYRRGYKEGSRDYALYNQGCYDADTSSPPESDDAMYLEGYKDC